MSIDYSCYIGPFVEVETEVIGGIDKIPFSHYADAFGDAIVPNIGYGPPEPFEREGKTFRKYAFIPNSKPLGLHIDQYDCGVWEFKDDVNRQIDCAAFQFNYGTEIDMLRKAYGNIQIKWGMVKYAS